MSIALLISLLATLVSVGRECVSGPECVYRSEYVSGAEFVSGPEYASGPEYVYGPEYVDEFVALLDEEREPVFILQDGNYNVVAAVSSEGAVVEDLAYTPYGRPVSHRYQGTLGSGAPLLLGIGHQGLFFDRFDLTPGQPPLELGAGVRGVYSNRNRSYSAILGRFLQQDVSGGALALQGLQYAGAIPAYSVSMFDEDLHYADGLNLYFYGRGNPVRFKDPRGLFSFGDILSSVATNNMRAAGAYDAYARGQQFVSDIFAGIALRNLLLDFAVNAATDYVGGKAFDLAVDGFNAIKGLLRSQRSARQRATRGLEGPCNCFVAGTLVDTPDGAEPIECIEVGDQVLTAPEGYPAGQVRTGVVTRVFDSLSLNGIIWLAFDNGVALGITPGHTVWTRERGWGFASDLLIGDTFQALDGNLAQIEHIRYDPVVTTVHNLEIASTWTYFVEGLWTHNDSCDFAPGQLDAHWEKHRGEWSPPLSKADYEAMSQGFLGGSATAGTLEKVRPNGDTVRYNPTTQEFGVVSGEGTIRTYFVPDPAKHGYNSNLDYFNAQ